MWIAMGGHPLVTNDYILWEPSREDAPAQEAGRDKRQRTIGLELPTFSNDDVIISAVSCQNITWATAQLPTSLLSKGGFSTIK